MLPGRLANNVAGQYKRGAAIALHIGFGNFAGGTSIHSLSARNTGDLFK